MPSVFIKTYGCQMNERDSEAVAAQLVAKGYTLAASEATAEIILLNTCSVHDAAEQKAIGKMQNLAASARRSRPQVILGYLGCMAQTRGQSLIDTLPDVDLVIGTQKFHQTARHLDNILKGRSGPIVDIGEEPGSESTIKEHLPGGKSSSKSVSAFVSIMQGCNQFCTFCIVPHTRGRERSRTIEDIVRECHELAANGIKEITLLGQIVNHYGKREIGVRDGKTAFVQLLEAVHAVDGLERIRFTSPHPKGYGADLVEAYARLPKLCECAHLPVQSGSNRILKRMHRGYTRERFLEIVRQLRAIRPRLGITTDLIVGFPGETEEDYEETSSLASEVGFDSAFIFKYSPRRNTPAADLDNPVPPETIITRHAALLKLMNQIGRKKYETYVGETVEVLVEGPSRRNPARLEGRTRSNKIVVFPGTDAWRGQLLPVRIERAGTFTLYGEVRSQP